MLACNGPSLNLSQLYSFLSHVAALPRVTSVNPRLSRLSPLALLPLPHLTSHLAHSMSATPQSFTDQGIRFMSLKKWSDACDSFSRAVEALFVPPSLSPFSY